MNCIPSRRKNLIRLYTVSKNPYNIDIAIADRTEVGSDSTGSDVAD